MLGQNFGITFLVFIYDSNQLAADHNNIITVRYNVDMIFLKSVINIILEKLAFPVKMLCECCKAEAVC